MPPPPLFPFWQSAVARHPAFADLQFGYRVHEFESGGELPYYAVDGEFSASTYAYVPAEPNPILAPASGPCPTVALFH